MRVAAIRIDVHPVGENPIHTTRMLPAPVHIHFLHAVSVRDNLLLAITSVGRTLLLSRKRAPDTTSSPTKWSTGLPPSFSPNTVIEAVMKSKHLLTNKLHQFAGPITPTCDWYVQYLLTEANPSVLNRHRRRLQPFRCWLSTYHSPTFPTNGLQFLPKGPTRSPVIQNLPKIPRFKFKKHMATTWSFDHSVIYRNLHLCLVIANDLSLALGFTRIDRKVT
jgi:hypothetical protein